MKRMTVLLIFFVFTQSSIFPQENKISMSVFTLTDQSHNYYLELLDKSLEAIGYSLELELLADVSRRRREFMLDQDDTVCLHRFLQTEERDRRWYSIDIGLTDSLVGKRILFIKRGNQHLFDQVQTLDDFRSLNFVGGFGEGWFDIDIWEHNDLLYYIKKGEWNHLYYMLDGGNRGIDYLSRGFTEILYEAELYSFLDIEERLILIYDRDFHFYLSDKAGELYGEIIKEALFKAEESGLMDQLIRKYWNDSFDILHYDERVKIFLESP